MKYCLLFILLTILSLGYAGIQLQRTTFSQLPGWNNAQQSAVIDALKASCTKELSLAKHRSARRDVRATAAFKSACHKISRLSTKTPDNQTRAVLEENYTPYLVTNGVDANGLFTGYYEPTILGSLTRTGYYSIPLYGKPPSLVRVRINGNLVYRIKTESGHKRLPSRKQISDGPLLKIAPVLVWVHSKVDRFFLQIQGSGSVILENGKRILLGYIGQNGHRYYAIGHYLVQVGEIPREQVSMQSIKTWLNDNPSEALRVMNMNPSFVFFRRLTTEHPIGAEGIPLTPGKSLAVDTKLIPLGMLLWVSSVFPHNDQSTGKIISEPPLRRLMVSQDTGGAIKGAVRGDVFWGSGNRAEWLAGHMQSPGRYWILLPKGVSTAIITK